MRNLKFLAAGLVVLGLTNASSPSRACTAPPIPEVHQLDPAAQATDHVAPVLSNVAVSKIERGPDAIGTCSGQAELSLSVTATDDQADPDMLGFRVSLADGSLPAGFTLLPGARRPPNGHLVLGWWFESRTAPVPPLSFTLSVVAVDLAGNESAAQTVLVQDMGVQEETGGCRVAGASGPAAPATVLVLAALIAAAQRRRRVVARS